MRTVKLLASCWLALALIATAATAAVVTERISITSYGGSTNGASWWPAFSSDARYVAFFSGGGNIVPGDTNSSYDVFLRDRLFGSVERVSVSSAEEPGNGPSYEPAMSRDGRYVAFVTGATNLIPGDTNGVSDIVVRDRELGLTLLASVSATDAAADRESLWCSISDDGRYVAFQSSATNLIPAGNLWPGIYVRDMVANVTECVSLPSGGGSANEISVKPSITPDGRYVVYRSFASNLVPDDTNGFSDVFIYDRNTDARERVSVATLTGAQSNNETASRPVVTPDGRYVVFASRADNLVPGDTNGAWDVFIRDRTADTTERVSVSSAEVEGNGDSGSDAEFTSNAYLLAMNDDGRYIVFGSAASNLVAGDTNGVWDTFVRDRTNGTTTRVSVATDGTQGNDHAGRVSVAITPDGQTIGFDSLASNLVLIDTNHTPDVFVHGEQLAPQAPGLVINNDDEYTNNPSVTLSIDPGDFSELRCKNEDDAWSAWEPAALTKTWTLSTGDGVKRVSIQGREGLTPSVENYDEIMLDTVGPSGLSITINDGAATTIKRPVSLTLTATGASIMRLRNETGEWSDWESYSGERAWKLSHDRGAKTVEVQFGDAAGNYTSVVTDTIDLICFTDMCTGYWAFEEIMACVDANIVQGYPEGDYQPLLSVSRDQMAVFVSRAVAGGDDQVPEGPVGPSFTDVPTDHWAYDYIEYAVNQQIVQGYPEGDYKPSQEVDRAQMAVFIARALAGGESAVPDGPATPHFPDVATDFWAYKHIEYIADPARAVTQGYPDGLYHPELVCTRDQMAVFVQRAFGL